jgi:hypothetical protein
MALAVGALVEHPKFGPGKVSDILGENVVVNFYGECIDCHIEDLAQDEGFSPKVKCPTDVTSKDKVSFRRGFEAVNLGVVPPDSSSLIEMSIGGSIIADEVRGLLNKANHSGLCKVVFGEYGTGKSHYLNLVQATAQQTGWVVSYLEFDPKAVDPAKPHLVYREIIANLSFPKREDGSVTSGFYGLIKEIRTKWHLIRGLPYLKRNPWFRYGLEVLQFHPHSETPDYVSACNWLGGGSFLLTGPGSIRTLARGTSVKTNMIPNMPKMKETGEIYVYHLVVINEICRALGYKGLLIILDEAEHVRGFSAPRKERANNLFELLARSAHLPLGEGAPARCDFEFQIPNYWDNGPHFGLFVGLTEGNTFEDDSLSLRDACVFLHSEDDRITLSPPSRDQYEHWCFNLLSNFHEYYPEKTRLLSSKDDRKRISKVLADEFEMGQNFDLVIRVWIKLACLVPSVVLSCAADSVVDIISVIQDAGSELTGGSLPWE